jgi:hypothetical protein
MKFRRWAENIDTQAMANVDEVHHLELGQRLTNSRRADPKRAGHDGDRRQAITSLKIARLN